MAKLSEQQFLTRLATKHQAPAWAFLSHVADGTGYNKCRTIDALAMSLWPSRGLELHGFEVKSSRTDWLRELKKPEKADSIGKHCHRFWLVANDGVAEDAELPPTWGLMIPHGRGLRVKKAADLMDPEPLSWSMFASLCRSIDDSVSKRIGESIPRSEIAEELAKNFRDGEELGRRNSAHDLERLRLLREAVEDFEEASGIKIKLYGESRKIGAAAALAIADRDQAIVRSARSFQRQLSSYQERLSSLIESAEGE